jgi:hypothetical protein
VCFVRKIIGSGFVGIVQGTGEFTMRNVRRKAGEIIMTMLSTSLHCIVGALLVISNNLRGKVETVEVS